MTITAADLNSSVVAHPGVYAPQYDSRLLVNALAQTGMVAGRRVLDLCTGSGVVAIAAARLGAGSVIAFDICRRAVRCARMNASTAAVDIDVHRGSLADALACGPYDVVVCNPPYVPTGSVAETIPMGIAPVWAWNAGDDGRLLLVPLCESAPGLLTRGGAMLVVQSEFSGVERSLSSLRSVGLDAEIIVWEWIPFGPVLSARARWLEAAGMLPNGRREEELVVIRADKP